MKRMAGSKNIIEMLNRFGQSVSYHIIEELETDLAQAINEKQRVCPDGIALDPNLVTCTTWDNYDEITETLSGSGGVHDTL